MSDRGCAHHSGFTLVEVLVALVIVALGMGAALAALSSAADNVARLRDRGFAQWIGFNQLSTARLALQMRGEGTSNGNVEDFANSRWHWQQQISKLDTPGIYRITVKVRRADDASDDSAAWLATVTGFRGDALAGASGEQPNWNGPPPTGQRGTGSGTGTGTGSDQPGSGGAAGGESNTPGPRNPVAPGSGTPGAGGGAPPTPPGPAAPPGG